MILVKYRYNLVSALTVKLERGQNKKKKHGFNYWAYQACLLVRLGSVRVVRPKPTSIKKMQSPTQAAGLPVGGVWYTSLFFEILSAAVL